MMRIRTTAGATAAAALSLLAGAGVAAPKPANLQLLTGAHVGVVNLLDPEVTHFHASRHLRSEEHTSELQSRSDLVCRLLLEKKKKKKNRKHTSNANDFNKTHINHHKLHTE